MESIKSTLKVLHLTGVMESLESRHEHALSQQLSYLEFLELLLEDEQALRTGNSFRRRLKASKLSEQKRLDNYDFAYQPELNQKRIQDLAACRYIQEGSNVIFMGKPGVGKTHLANVLGLAALKQQFKVHFIHANQLIEQLHLAKADGSYHKALGKLLRTDLLIMDELGFKKVPPSGLDDFFEIIRQRYEIRLTIITTNRYFEDWAEILGDAVLASAIIDRLLHHAEVFKITGESYRMKEYV